jgi:putative transcriptional regulator
MKTIRSHMRMLLAAKSQREGRTISLRELQRDTEVPISTVMGMANNTIKRVPLEELNALCEYFDCDIGDLLKREEAES